MLREIDPFRGGKSYSSGDRSGDVFDPNQGQVQAKVRLGTAADLERAMQAAKAAQPAWALANPQRRAEVLFKFVDLVNRIMGRPRPQGALVGARQGHCRREGRHPARPRGHRVRRRRPHALKGEFSELAPASTSIRCASRSASARASPVQLPGHDPALDVRPGHRRGNAFILKPSERDPSVPIRLAELMIEAGLPAGVLNVVHGDKETVDAILDHPDIQAVSFVGSSHIARYVYRRGTANGKRVQASAAPRTTGSSCPTPTWTGRRRPHGRGFGSAGERCMALPVAVPVGEETGDALASADAADRQASGSAVHRRQGLGLRPGGHRAAHKQSIDYIQPASTKAPSWSSTAAASSCRATRAASSSAPPCSTT